MLVLFDFNPMRVRDAIRQHGYSSERRTLVTTVEHRSILPKGKIFTEDVVSEMPYISARCSAANPTGAIVNYEEGLALVPLNIRERPAFSHLL
jgi:hypothetical protein